MGTRPKLILEIDLETECISDLCAGCSLDRSGVGLCGVSVTMRKRDALPPNHSSRHHCTGLYGTECRQWPYLRANRGAEPRDGVHFGCECGLQFGSERCGIVWCVRGDAETGRTASKSSVTAPLHRLVRHRVSKMAIFAGKPRCRAERRSAFRM